MPANDDEPWALVDPLALSRTITDGYRNMLIGRVNDHEIRMSVVTRQFPWHIHPDSDETFCGVDGELLIEFRNGQAVVGPGQMVTVAAGTPHRTRPVGERCVNLTFERARAPTVFDE